MTPFRPPLLLTTALVVVFIYLWGLLHAESQLAVGVLLAAVPAVLWAMRRAGLAEPLASAARVSPKLLGIGCVLGTLALVAALHEEHFALLLLSSVLLYTVVGLGLNLQFGYAGIVNFAGAAFFGIGSYTAATLATHTAVPHLLVLLICGGVAAVLGSMLIWPVLRTRGHYAALVTIAFGILFRNFLEVNDALGGPQGLRIPDMTILGWNLNKHIEIGDTEISFYANYALLALVLCVVAFVFVRRVERSWLGLSMDMIRTDEVAAATFGVSIARGKVLAFTMGNFLAGTAGAVYGMMTSYVAPNNFTFGDSLILVSIVILGGIGNPWGLLPAAAIVLILPEKFQFIQEYRFLLYAVLVILILLFRPEGLLPRTVRQYFPGGKKAVAE
ncbi:MAG: branched-chain amino acid ABC transporter permease [Rubrivivax sp.]|nr:branched-chain amino acid ABC transporter permease [Rubrivivax sp.]